jgi:uncharacterized protein involved in response to NO
MNTVPTGIPRYRPTTAPALFSQGFRPFFLGAGLWAVASVVIWMLVLIGWLDLPGGFDPVAWHAHEMIYGFAIAAMAGFLLTAIPNWTGRFPLQGVPLVVLFLTWGAGRFAMFLSGIIGPLPTALIDMSFLLLLLCATAREVFAGRNWRNLPAIIALLLLLISNGLTHFEASGFLATRGMGHRLALGVLVCLITLVGGRIIPSFTRNRLARQRAARAIAAAGPFDALVLALVPIALASWVIGATGALQGALLISAGLASVTRLSRWQGLAIWRDVLISALHLGYAWVSVGLTLLGLSQISSAVPELAALHALGAGAIGTMILAVMVRALLAHTGRPQVAGAGTVTLYGLLQIAALLRVAAAFLPNGHSVLAATSGVSWAIAFAMFVHVHGRYLLQAHTKRPGPT